MLHTVRFLLLIIGFWDSDVEMYIFKGQFIWCVATCEHCVLLPLANAYNKSTVVLGSNTSTEVSMTFCFFVIPILWWAVCVFSPVFLCRI